MFSMVDDILFFNIRQYIVSAIIVIIIIMKGRC